jgi:cytochrome c-type biogenesis protein CcmE
MKISYIIGVLVIAVGILVIVSTAGDASQYVNFSQAAQLAKGGDEKDIHVVGTLVKGDNGKPLLYYNPEQDADRCTFDLQDSEQKVSRVILLDTPPQDLDKSEKVVVIGHVEDDVFIASKVLMKCPSKYQEGQGVTAAKL